jgi:hypothetical protein
MMRIWPDVLALAAVARSLAKGEFDRSRLAAAPGRTHTPITNVATSNFAVTECSVFFFIMQLPMKMTIMIA